MKPTKLAFLDLETTGIEPFHYDQAQCLWLIPYHEIIDIGVVLLDPNDEEHCIKEFEQKVHPEYPDRCSGRARQINGFNQKAWRGAASLQEVMDSLMVFLDGAMIWGSNVAFDWSFLAVAFEKTGHTRSMLDGKISYRKRDAVSFSLGRVLDKNAPVDFSLLHTVEAAVSLATVDTREFERNLRLLDEPVPHRAIVGARRSFTLFRRGWGWR